MVFVKAGPGVKKTQTRLCKQKVHSKPISVHSWFSGHPGTARQGEVQRPRSSESSLRGGQDSPKGNERTGT